MWAQPLSGVALRHPRCCPRRRDHEGVRAPRASLWDESYPLSLQGSRRAFRR